MPSASPRIGIQRPLSADPFDVQDFYDNYTLIDSYPGTFVCTSSTRPTTWGASQKGIEIVETDTMLKWMWTGTAFVRSSPVGVLGSSNLTSDFTTTATSSTSTSPAATAISCTVAIPATNSASVTKRIRVTGSYYLIDNDSGICEVTLYRDTTLLYQASLSGETGATTESSRGSGGSIVGFDFPSTAGGSTTYTLRVNSLSSPGGTTTLSASGTSPATLMIEEVGV